MSAASEKFLRILRAGDPIAEQMTLMMIELALGQRIFTDGYRLSQATLERIMGKVPEPHAIMSEWMLEVEAGNFAAVPSPFPTLGEPEAPLSGPSGYPFVVGEYTSEMPHEVRGLVRLPSGAVLNLNHLTLIRDTSEPDEECGLEYWLIGEEDRYVVREEDTEAVKRLMSVLYAIEGVTERVIAANGGVQA